MKPILASLLTLLFAACTATTDRAIGFWDDTNLTDPALTQQSDAVDSRFAEYTTLLNNEDVSVCGPLLQATLERTEASTEVFHMFWELCEKYLYSPDSPLRNEELYGYALQTIIASGHIDDFRKIRPRYQLNMIARNRIGEPATEIAYTLPDGQQSALYAIDCEYTILYFNNPDCPACDEVRTTLAKNRIVRRLSQAGRLRVVALYTCPDENKALWQQSLGSYPPDWIAAYDEGAQVHYQGLYDLRNIPCLYLLDADKRVLVKGAICAEPVIKALKAAISR